MIVSGISPEQFKDAVSKANVMWDNNLQAVIGAEYPRKDGTVNRFNARVIPVHTGYQLYGKGTELAPGQKRSWQGRRTAACCWHAYRDVLIEVFNINPEAKVKTMFAKYYGREEFYKLFPLTQYRNVGSAFQPITAGELCDC